MKRHSAKQKLWRRSRALAAVLTFVALYTSTAAAQKAAPTEIQIQKCWAHPYEGAADRRLAADGNAIFTVRESSLIDAVAVATGKLLWSSDVGGNIDSNLTALDGKLFLVRRPVAETDDARGSLIALSAATGIPKWTAQLPDSGTDITLASTGGVILAVSSTGSVMSADARNGRVVWSKKAVSEISGEPFLAGSSLYFASQGKNIGQMSLDGVLSTAISAAPFALTALARTEDASIVAGDERGQITMYSGPLGKVIWKFTSGAAISSILVNDSAVLAASNDNFIYALTLSGGGRIWKRRVSGRVQAMRLMGDGLVLVEAVGEKEILLLNAMSGKTAAKIGFAGEESPLAALSLGDSLVTVMTDNSIYLYSTASCPAK